MGPELIYRIVEAAVAPALRPRETVKLGSFTIS